MDKVFLEILNQLKEIDFATIGSTNMKLQGIDVVPNDVDFLTDDVNIEKVAKIFSSKISNDNGYKETEFKIDNIDIHFVSSSSNSLRVYDCHKVILIDVWGLQIPVMPLELELEFYRKFNTKKAQNKVKLIMEKLNK